MKWDMAEVLVVLVIMAASFACGVVATYLGLLWSGSLA